MMKIWISFLLACCFWVQNGHTSAADYLTIENRTDRPRRGYIQTYVLTRSGEKRMCFQGFSLKRQETRSYSVTHFFPVDVGLKRNLKFFKGSFVVFHYTASEMLEMEGAPYLDIVRPYARVPLKNCQRAKRYRVQISDTEMTLNCYHSLARLS